VAGQFDVSIVDYAFDPPSLEIPMGASVKWTNNGAHNHTATHTPPAGDPAFDSDRLLVGEHYRKTFDTAGTYPYDCELHRGGVHPMNGTIVVKA
jgi:plastocyanin